MVLDLHCTSGTPGATTALGNLATICPNDGCPVAGVPIRDTARLIQWSSVSLNANTVLNTRLISQDMIDPINGEYISLGATSLANLVSKYTNIPYKTGARTISQTTNTAQTATSIGGLLDFYEGGNVANPGFFAPNQIVVPQTLATNIAVSWTSTGLAPATAIPNGKYAILGAWGSLQTMPIFLRFSHADFGGFKPGFPLNMSFGAAAAFTEREALNPLQQMQGFQFVALSNHLGRPVCPVFVCSNAGTGLGIEAIATANTDTPRLNINLAKVG